MYKSCGASVKGTFRAELEADDGTQIAVSIYPPKMKVMRMLQQIDLESDTAMEETIKAVSDILSHNMEKRKFGFEMVEELFDVTDLNEFLTDFYDWVGNLKKK